MRDWVYWIFPRLARLQGPGLPSTRGMGARLERGIDQFYDGSSYNRARIYRGIPPFMVHRRSMVGTGQLPKFEEDAFRVADTEYF